ncbi:MAG: hypothetical protein JSS28_07425, partial [Proteobacteria bacterium]|nr:hypothetical protein [Pseudomonadota bacterium]
MLHNDLLRNLARYCVTLAFAMPLAANATGGTYLVGPDGVYATIQDAVNQAVTDGGGTIKIEQGFYFESVVIGLSNAATVLNISGSWNQYFSSNLSYLTSGTPTSIVTPDPGSNALYVNASAGELNIQD